MRNRTNREILEEIHYIKGHQTNTIHNYQKAVKQYCQYHQMTLQELIDEAETEEEQGIRWKHRRLRNRLIKYRQYLTENYSPKSINTYYSPIINIYRYHEIEIQQIPQIENRRLKKSAPISYKDLPDKEIIRHAIEIASPVMKPLLLFMVSSGCAKRETLNLTIMDYMEATKEWHNTTNITEMIDTLNQIDSVVPTFNILRVKTNKYYTTYCTPETVKAINHYLTTRTNLHHESPLFKIGETTFTLSFEEINDQLGLGKIGNYRRFRSHMLRKFHASALYNDGLSLDKINDLQGKAKNKTDSVYFMTNPEDLKHEYIQHMNAVTISKEVEKVTVKSKEFLELENRNRELENKVDSILGVIDQLENLSWEDLKKEY